MSIRGEQAEVIEVEAMPASAILGRPLKDIPFPRDVLLTGIVHQECAIIPYGRTIISPGDRVIFFAKKEAVLRLGKMLSVELGVV
jgi:trk system potassium uptake protein TrkA